MIKNFADKKSEKVYIGEYSKEYSLEIQNQARKKLRMINNAINLEDLKVPPGNKLESLKGNRKGQYSIRINDQWRICFIWKGNNAHSVEIVDYH